MINGNNRAALETFLVASAGDVALYNTAGSGNNISNPSTSAVRLADGQLGIFCDSIFGTVALNVATDATPTKAEAPNIYIAQGTADSAAPSQSSYSYPLFPRPYERSGTIVGNGEIYATKQAYTAPTWSGWVVGNASTGAIAAANNTTYGLTIAYTGRAMTEDINHMARRYFVPSYTTPNYTALGTVNPIDHLVQNMVYQINRQSQVVASQNKGSEPVYAIALNLGGTGGTARASIAAGYLPLVTTSTGTRGVTLTAAQATSLIATLPVGCSVITIDLTTAGTAATTDAFAVIALDRKLAYDDRVPQTKIGLQIGKRYGFASSVYCAQVTFAFEGQGVGRILDLEYKRTHQQRKYTLNHDENPIIHFPSPVSTTGTYNRYNIEHVTNNTIDSANTVKVPQLAVILIPTASTTTVTQWDAAIDSWLTSVGSDLVTI